MNYCLYHGHKTNKDIFLAALKHFQDESPFIASDTIDFTIAQDLSAYAMINFYHIIFGYDGTLLFTSIDDYNLRSGDAASLDKILLITKDDIVKESNLVIDNKTNIFIYDPKKQKIRKAKNAELQPLFRE